MDKNLKNYAYVLMISIAQCSRKLKNLEGKYPTLHKICKNTGFHCPLFSHIFCSANLKNSGYKILIVSMILIIFTKTY